MTRLAPLALAAAFIAGCASAPRAPDADAVPDPGSLRHWSASGRMAVAAGSDGGSGSFDWRQDGAVTRLDLRGPLGAGAMSLQITPDALTLTDGTGRSLDADAARAALRARLGADLPWSHLRYWMLGLPAPAEVATSREFDATPWRVIEQSGWTLAYDSFADVGGSSLPQRFSAQHGEVRVRVIVDRWLPGAPATPGQAESPP